MINLQKISALPIEITDDFHLKFLPPLADIKPSVRNFSEMTPVLMDSEVKPMPPREEMYYMYRDIHLLEHEDIIRKHNVRYDITVIPPVMLGQEFNKTVGHYHPQNARGVAFPEIYEVLYGQALFLIQKMDENFEKVLAVNFIEARPGEKVIYPPGFGHIIVNVGNEVLITANWVADNFKSLYDPVARRRGMAYYVVADQAGNYKFLPNKSYSDIPKIFPIGAEKFAQFPIAAKTPMYLTGVYNPETLEILNFPEKYSDRLLTAVAD